MVKIDFGSQKTRDPTRAIRSRPLPDRPRQITDSPLPTISSNSSESTPSRSSIRSTPSPDRRRPLTHSPLPPTISSDSSESTESHSPDRRRKTRDPKRVYALDEIARIQAHGRCLIPRKRFENVVKEVLGKHGDYRIRREATEALQCSAEYFITELFQDANVCAAHAKRVTVQPVDFDLTKRLRRM